MRYTLKVKDIQIKNGINLLKTLNVLTILLRLLHHQNDFIFLVKCLALQVVEGLFICLD